MTQFSVVMDSVSLLQINCNAFILLSIIALYRGCRTLLPRGLTRASPLKYPVKLSPKILKLATQFKNHIAWVDTNETNSEYSDENTILTNGRYQHSILEPPAC